MVVSHGHSHSGKIREEYLFSILWTCKQPILQNLQVDV